MYRIGQVAAQLNMSPVVIRSLSKRFADWLSQEDSDSETSGNGQIAIGLYTEEDLELLYQLYEWQEEGLSDDEIMAQLESEEDDDEEDANALTVIDSEGEDPLLTRTAALAIGQALHQIGGTQQALLTSQKSQREMLGMILDDAAALKDENERLRKRLRMMEEEMARLKESDWNHRLALEERMAQLEQHVPKKRSLWDRFRGQ